MKINGFKYSILAGLAATALSWPEPPLRAEENDYSCIDYRVRQKTQVTERHREFDIIVKNQCPGPVYWSMCIERMDPWTHRIAEKLEPSGKVAVDKKTRVNLQMMRVDDRSGQRSDYESFYLNIAYSIEPVIKATCVASQCEAKKRSLREEAVANDRAWQKSLANLAARLKAECPRTDWNKTAQEACALELQEQKQAELDSFAQKDSELKEQLSAIDPELCQLHSGG